MRIALVLVCLLLSWRIEGATNVWIDTDPAIGSPFREIDDAFALVLAFHSPELRIAGISTTYGNAGLRRTTSVARDLVRRFGEHAGITTAQVYPGSRSAADFWKQTAASEALARALQKERLTYVALGPLTNLAALLEQHPNLASRFERVIFVGGKSPSRVLAFGPTGWLAVHDANVFKDPGAARRLLHSDIPLVLSPIETSSRLLLLPSDIKNLGQSGGAGEFLQKRSRFWMWFWTGIVQEKGGPVFDALAVMDVARPQSLIAERRYAVVDASGALIAAQYPVAGSRSVRFCTGFTADPTTWLLSRLSARAIATKD